MKSKDSGDKSSTVEFVASGGEKFEGWLVRLGQFTAVFNILGRADAVRTSEILPSCRVVLAGRVVYEGRGTISKLINEADSFTCEVQLSETGVRIDALPEPTPAEFERFLGGWLLPYQLSSGFKVAVADFEILMVELRRWLNQIEVRLQAANPEDVRPAQARFLAQIGPQVMAAMRAHAERFDELVALIKPGELEAHRDYVFRMWGEHVLSAPFAYRTFHKPLGYAGDYEMMNMIHRDAPEGESLFGRLMHQMLVRSWPAESVRNRIGHLQEILVQETARVARQGRRARILNVGCGPAWEVQNFIRETALSEQADFTLLDFNEETLRYTGGRMEEVRRAAGRQTSVTMQQTSVQQLLRLALQHGGQLKEKYDLIYCAGLFDYLSEATCKALVHLFAKSVGAGGLVVVSNMNDSKPFRTFIEWLLDWYLIYRNAAQMKLWSPPAPFSSSVVAEPTTVNLFLNVRGTE